MTLFANRDVNRLAVFSALAAFAWGLSGVFSTVFLLRVGVPPTGIFLAFAGILAARFLLRPLVMVVVPVAGARNGLILGTFLTAVQFPALGLVQGTGLALVLYCGVVAISQVFYCTCDHVVFAALGDADRRGSQIGVRQALAAGANVLSPLAGGIMLANAGPSAAFGTAFAVQLAAIIPLLGVADPPIAPLPPPAAYSAAKTGVRLYFADGFIQCGAATAWDIILFEALGGRFDSFGGTLSAAALAGALGGVALGRFIDLGHARNMVGLNAAILAVGLTLKAVCGGSGQAIAVVAVAIGTTLLGGLYIPSWMTAAYNEARDAPCTLRFQFAAEGGWDAGGVLASLIAAALCAVGTPIWVIVLAVLPMVAVQAFLLDASYASRARLA